MELSFLICVEKFWLLTPSHFHFLLMVYGEEYHWSIISLFCFCINAHSPSFNWALWRVLICLPSDSSSRVPQWQKCLRLELRGGGTGRTSPARPGTAGQRRPHLRAGRGRAESHPAGRGGQRPGRGGHLCCRGFPQGEVLPHGLHAALHVQPCKWMQSVTSD